MAMKNTGKPSEKEFEDGWARLGKKAWVHRFEDGAELYAKNKRSVANSKKPSDYIIAHAGAIHYAEVKSSQDKTAFRFSLLKPGQFAAGRMCLAAGGSYFVYVKRMLTDEWFKVPFSAIAMTRDLGCESMPWETMSHLSWSPANP